jgi:serine/threonine protein kinase
MMGKTLGNFEITAKIGRDGMGEAYQAKFLKLGRDVAIKVLPEEFAKDEDRVARFEREINGLLGQPCAALLRLDTREWQILLHNAADARFVSPGHLVFLRQGTLMAVRFDLAGMRVIGHEVALVENIMQAISTSIVYNTNAGQYS